MSKVCPQCQYPNPDNFTHCSRCRWDLSRQKEVIIGNAKLICATCKADIEENSAFCKKCGARITNNPKKAVMEYNILKCSGCGTQISETTQYCPKCGAYIYNLSNSVSYKPPKPGLM